MNNIKKQKHSTLKFLPGMNRPIFVFDRSKIERIEKKVAPGGATHGVSNEKDRQRLLPDSS